MINTTKMATTRNCDNCGLPTRGGVLRGANLYCADCAVANFPTLSMQPPGHDAGVRDDAIPTPWRVSGNEGDKGTYIVADSDRWGQSGGVVLIAQMKRHRSGSADRVAPDEIQSANAARIVRCVNAHEELVAALTNVLAYSTGQTNDIETLKAKLADCAQVARGALKHAQEGE